MVKVVVVGMPEHAVDCPFARDINLTGEYTCLLQQCQGSICNIELTKTCDKLIVAGVEEG